MTSLAAVLTVHDAETLLPEVVASIRDHVDEIVVGIDVDHTQDRTREVAESLGCRVTDVHIMRDGERDFAQARNQTWAFARETFPNIEWFVWIDKDDVLVASVPLKQLIAEAQAVRPNVEQIWLPYLYSRDANGNPNIRHYRERIIKASANPVWRARLHETCWTDRSPIEIWSEAGLDYDKARVWVDHKNRRETEAGKWERNFPILMRMVDEDPNDLRAVREVGEAYFAATQWAKAVEWYDRYLERTAGSAGTPLEERWLVVVYKAKAERMQGRILDALRTADRAFNMCPWFADACYELMYNYVAQGAWTKALYWFDEGRERRRPDGIFPTSPSDYEGMPNRFIHEAYAAVGDLPKAVECVEKALAFWPDDPDLNAALVRYAHLHNRRSVIESALQNARFLLSTNEPLKARSVLDNLPAGAAEDHAGINTLREDIASRLAHLGGLTQMRQLAMSQPLPEDDGPTPVAEWLRRVLPGRTLWFGIDRPSDVLAQKVPVVGADIDPRKQARANRAAVEAGHLTLSDAPRYTAQKVAGHPRHGADCYVVRGEDGLPATETIDDVTTFVHGDTLTCGMGLHEHIEWEEGCDLCGPVERLPVVSTVAYLRPELPFQFFVGDIERPYDILRDLGPYDAIVLNGVLEQAIDVERALASAESLAPLVVILASDGTAPTEERPGVVRAWSQKELEQLVWKRGQLVESNFGIAYRHGVDLSGRMPVVIYCGPGLEPWTPDQIDREGLGGSETAVVHLAKELVARGFRVMVYAEAEGVWDGVYYRHHSRFVPENPVGLFIAWRNPMLVDQPLAAERKVLWMHDVDSGDALTEERAQKFDGVLVLSEWHKRHMRERYPFIPEDKFTIIGNGIDPARFDGSEERDPNRFLYVSSPDRGLERALVMWPFIRKALPEAVLHVYYGWENYDRLGRDPAFKFWCLDKAKQEGVEWHGRIGQRELAREMMRSGGLFYPGPHGFEETYCISVLEAQAAGCVPVTRDNGALPETNCNGILLSTRYATVNDYIAGLRETASFDREAMASWAKTQTWGAVCDRLLAFIRASYTREEVAA